MFGYAGKFLRIDLSTGKIEKKESDPRMQTKFVGGIGMSARFLFDSVLPNTDALSRGNALIASSGPFSGTSIIGANKTDWTFKSPLTGMAATAASGDFGTHLKWAGYDSMVIKGKASKPVYVTIFDDEVRINEAADLWGMDNYATADEQIGRAHV